MMVESATKYKRVGVRSGDIIQLLYMEYSCLVAQSMYRK